MAFIWLIIACPVFAMKPASEYGYNECGLIAKDFQRENYGSLIFIIPLKPSGAFEMGAYAGHMMNRYYNYSQKKVIYVDYQNNLTFNNTKEIRQFWIDIINKDVKIYDLGQEHPPFAINWHY